MTSIGRLALRSVGNAVQTTKCRNRNDAKAACGRLSIQPISPNPYSDVPAGAGTVPDIGRITGVNY
jgi:hypothetical protein